MIKPFFPNMWYQTQVQLPAAQKASDLEAMAGAREVELFKSWQPEKTQTMSQRPSLHLSAGRGFYEQGRGRQDRGNWREGVECGLSVEGAVGKSAPITILEPVKQRSGFHHLRFRVEGDQISWSQSA